MPPVDDQDQDGAPQNSGSSAQSNQGQQPVVGFVAPPVLDPPVVAPPPLPKPLPPPEVPPLEPPPEPPPVEALPWVVFLAVLLTPTSTAPPWMDELNPITGGPYKSKEEYESIRQLTPDEIRKRAAEYRRQQLAKAQTDTQKTTCDSPVGSSTVPCPTQTPTTAASSKPTPGAIPQTLVMPSGMSKVDQELWSDCKSLHDGYKNTQDATKDLLRRVNPIKDDLANNRPTTPQQRMDFCNSLRQLIELLARLHKERKKYIDNGCDKFDWFRLGTTEAKRRQKHLDALNDVDLQSKNLWKVHGIYCK